jgi:hypothetical protein
MKMDDDRHGSLFNYAFFSQNDSDITGITDIFELYNHSDIIKSGDTCAVYLIVLHIDNHKVLVTSFSGRNMQFIQATFSHKFYSLLLSITSAEINVKPFNLALTII